MTISLRCATFVAVAISLTYSAELALSQAPATDGTRVAVIDISQVFKNHTRFKQAMDSMKSEVEAFEAQLQQRGQQIEALKTQMQSYKSGTAEYKGVEMQIAKSIADGQAETQVKRKDFLEKEAQVYFSVYTEVVNAVSVFAQQNNIGLVVRFNSEAIDPENRKSVLEGVNRPVIYQRNLNITSQIVDQVNRVASGNVPVQR